jgi:predicted porin
MKQVFTSVGIMALGAASLYAYDPEMTRQLSGRPWTVAATVRGFYDDNVTTSSSRFKEDSFGLEVSPSAHLNLPMEQTFISLGYIYSLRWYQDRDPNEIDQSHEFNAKLRHQFNPRHDISVDESFILTSEPTIAERFGIITSPVRTRTDSDILHNRASINYMAGLSQRVSLGIGYNNDLYDYEQEGAGSRSALLDRLEHLIHADARYQFNPSLVGLIGYSFRLTTYTGDDVIFPGLMSDDRDSHSHYGYVGGDYDLTAKLRATVRVGGQFTEYSEADESSVSPYADASLTYVFRPSSSITVGVRHDRNATDIVNPDGKGTPTLDAESTVAYLQLIHQITSKLTGSLIGQYQTSEFNDGASDGQVEDLYLLGVNLSYSFNRHFSAEAGYNYDFLDSDVNGRDYHRNRVYLGVRATY